MLLHNLEMAGMILGSLVALIVCGRVLLAGCQKALEWVNSGLEGPQEEAK